jgi:hypothetical protein
MDFRGLPKLSLGRPSEPRLIKGCVQGPISKGACSYSAADACLLPVYCLYCCLYTKKVSSAGQKEYGGHTYRMLRRTITCQYLSTLHAVLTVGALHSSDALTAICVDQHVRLIPLVVPRSLRRLPGSLEVEPWAYLP